MYIKKTDDAIIRPPSFAPFSFSPGGISSPAMNIIQACSMCPYKMRDVYRGKMHTAHDRVYTGKWRLGMKTVINNFSRATS